MVLVLLLLSASTGFAQTTKKPSAKPATKAGSTSTRRAASKAAGNDPTQPSESGKPTADIQTTAGTLTCELFPDKVPNGVANFVGLATGTKDWTDPNTGQKKHGVPLYNGTIFHRVIPDFMVQGGDPLGTGTGGPGFRVNDEFSPDLTFDEPGMLAYANSGPNTNGSQFFITEVPYPFLNACLDDGGCLRGGRRVPKGYGYVVLGKCTPESVEVVKKIARQSECTLQTALQGGAPGPCDFQRSRPVTPVKIERIKISGMPKPPAKAAPKRPAGTAIKKPAPKK